MGKNFQTNFSLCMKTETLSKLKLLSQASNLSMAQIVNQVMSEYVKKFSTELAEIENSTRTAAFKIKEKFFGETVKRISIKKLPTNTGARLAAVDDDQIVAAVKIEKVDEEKAKDFIQKAMTTIGNGAYEITRADNSITVTTGEKILSQEFEDAGTAAKVEALIDDVIGQVTRQAILQ